MARKIAGHMWRAGCIDTWDREDFEQEACLGLWRATGRYDERLGLFLNYALHWASGAVREAVRSWLHTRFDRSKFRGSSMLPRRVSSHALDKLVDPRPADPLLAVEVSLLLDEIECLPPRVAEVMRRRAAGEPFRKIADSMGFTVRYAFTLERVGRVVLRHRLLRRPLDMHYSAG